MEQFCCKITIGCQTHQIPANPYLYLFCLTNTNTDMDIIRNRIQKFISIFILNGYGYNSDTESMNIIIDISWIIKLYDYKIKDITKKMINQVNSMHILLYAFC